MKEFIEKMRKISIKFNVEYAKNLEFTTLNGVNKWKALINMDFEGVMLNEERVDYYQKGIIFIVL